MPLNKNCCIFLLPDDGMFVSPNRTALPSPLPVCYHNLPDVWNPRDFTQPLWSMNEFPQVAWTPSTNDFSDSILERLNFNHHTAPLVLAGAGYVLAPEV